MKDITSQEFIDQNFKPEKTLCPDLFNNNDGKYLLKSDVRSKLITIAELFVKSLDIPNLDIQDIYLVGSMANYNWSSESDIDLHIVLDYSQLSDNQKTNEVLLKAKKDLFNDAHELKIKGYEIELGSQDVDEELVTAGCYSILYNMWIKKPNKEELDIDRKLIIKKYKQFLDDFNNIKKIKDFKKRILAIDKFKNKLSRYRKSGLNSDGEFSIENIIYKYLRRIGFIDSLKQLKVMTINKLGTLNQ